MRLFCYSNNVTPPTGRIGDCWRHGSGSLTTAVKHLNRYFCFLLLGFHLPVTEKWAKMYKSVSQHNYLSIFLKILSFFPKVMETRGRKLKRPQVKTTRNKTKSRGRVGRGPLDRKALLVPSHLYLDRTCATLSLPLTALTSLKYNSRLTVNWERVSRKPNHIAYCMV